MKHKSIKPTKEENHDLIVFFSSILVIALFFFFVFGLQGLFSTIGIVLFFILSTYLIFDYFPLAKDEKLVFSFFSAVGLVSIFSYWLGLFISFRISIFIAFIILLAIGLCLRKKKSSQGATSLPEHNKQKGTAAHQSEQSSPEKTEKTSLKENAQ